jgi:hypothetical protein
MVAISRTYPLQKDQTMTTMFNASTVAVTTPLMSLNATSPNVPILSTSLEESSLLGSKRNTSDQQDQQGQEKYKPQ